MFWMDLPISGTILIICLVCILTVCIFEFVNGFHDTANAVATVIYTKSLKPIHAVIWSGFMNFLGVMTSSYIFGMAVAGKIASLLPLETVLTNNVNEAVAMVFAAIIAAIFWNLFTWYFGIPCSSSHTLIGSLLGVGLAFSFLPGQTAKAGVNWTEAIKIGNALLFSPLFGFSAAIALMFLLKKSIKDKAIFKEPDPESRPPLWIRAILIMTCTLVSFFHGSNDGQKGVGMMLIVLLAFMPTQYALSPHFDLGKMTTQIKKMEDALIHESTINYELERTLCAKAERLNDFYNYLDALDLKNNKAVMNARKQMTILSKEMKIVLNEPNLLSMDSSRKILKTGVELTNDYTHHTPWWIIVLISISLGIGTMIGWKRIVVTIGEKIGKRHMTYAEGASAELIASSTIGLASGFGLPVSTTHVLSSDVAGAMVASKGIKNLQAGTIKNIALAWILTLPVTMVLSAVLFLIFRMFI